MKKALLFLGLCLLGTSVLAGGSIFGGHKTRSSNPDGVSSIGVHICDSLNCPKVILKKGDCGNIEHASKKYSVCVCDDGYKVSGNKCVLDDKCEGIDLNECQTCDPKTGKITPKGDRTICTLEEEDDGLCKEGSCTTKCLVTGTCEGDSCKNGGDYPHCQYQCQCSYSGDGENACACADSLDKIVCSGYACITKNEKQNCKCAIGFQGPCLLSTGFSCIRIGKNPCACTEDESKIVCNNFACIAPTEERQVCRCSTYGANENACACADSLDQIVCNNYYACIAPTEGQVCRCSPYGANEHACACADSLDKIVCSDYACIAIPTD